MAQQAEQTWPTAPTTNPGTKPDAGQVKPPHYNPDAVEHAQIGDGKQQEGGKDMGLVKAPIVSMHPTSAKPEEAGKNNFKIIDNAKVQLSNQSDVEFKYPFADLEVKQGLFASVETTTDALMSKLFKQVDQFRKQNSEIERDENGDDVMEDVAINVKKRNEDGTVQLDGDKPRLDIKSGFRPKLIGPMFAVKAVVKGDKISENNTADSDGALVIRLV